MARLTACFALSAVLVLATRICSGNGQLLVSFHLAADEDNHQGDPSLSVAADDNGNVVLAKTNCRDARQLWVQHSPVPGENEFSLVNLGDKYQLRAMQIPEDGIYPVKLAAYSPWNVPGSVLWTQEAPLFDDGFYKIQSYKDERLVLDGLDGNVHEGTVVGAYPAGHDANHVLWKIEGFLSNP